jgi:hypothetical protein
MIEAARADDRGAVTWTLPAYRLALLALADAGPADGPAAPGRYAVLTAPADAAGTTGIPVWTPPVGGRGEVGARSPSESQIGSRGLLGLSWDGPLGRSWDGNERQDETKRPRKHRKTPQN